MRVLRLSALLVAVFAILLAVSVPARAADDYLEFSDPAPRQQLDRVPGWVTLVFKTEASATLAKILVQDAAGQSVTTGPLIVEGSNVTTQLKSGLPKGTYTVYYRTSDKNDQPRGGAFQFAFGKGEWTTVDTEKWIGQSAEPTVIAEPDPTLTPSATVTPTGPETYTPSPGPSDTASSTATPTPMTPAGSGAIGWFVGAGVLLVAAAGVAGWQIWKRRSGSGPRRGGE